jgi:hypothetical protein
LSDGLPDIGLNPSSCDEPTNELALDQGAGMQRALRRDAKFLQRCIAAEPRAPAAVLVVRVEAEPLSLCGFDRTPNPAPMARFVGTYEMSGLPKHDAPARDYQDPRLAATAGG